MTMRAGKAGMTARNGAGSGETVIVMRATLTHDRSWNCKASHAGISIIASAPDSLKDGEG
jgi:hypothetical protein